MPATDHEVIIVGGGPVGIGLAIELGQRGIRVLVIERHSEIQPIPKGQNLTQRTTETLHFWGCEKELRAARTIPPEVGMGGITLYRHLLSDYHFDWLNRASVNDYYLTTNERLPQYETERVLRARAAQVPGIEIRLGWTVERITDLGDHVEVEMVATNGTEREVHTARYLAGCDGSRSVVRETSGIPQTLSDHGRLMVLLVFRSNELHELLRRYPGKAFYKVLDPALEGYWQFFGRVDVGSFFFHAPVPHGTTADHDFRSMLHRIVGRPFALEIERIGFWDLRVSIAERYRSGRIFVAGDAAHSHPPYGGYGVNSGFEDARNLGWKLAATLRGWGGEILLESYDAERRPVFTSTARDFIEKSIAEDRRFLATYSPDTDRAAFERAWAAQNASPSGVHDFEPNYEGSPIVIGPSGTPSARGDHRFEARAGHHLAPRLLGDGSNVFDRLGAGFSLLSYKGGSAADAFVAAARQARVPLTVIEEEAPSPYGAPLVLVRPDHYVAWTGNSASGASAILRQATGLA